MKSTVKQNHWKGKKSKPKMSAHPGLCAADAPRGNAFSRAKQRRKNHENKAHDAERETDEAAATRALRRFHRIKDVYGRRNRKYCQRCESPAAVRFVHSHFAGPWPSISPKNVRGSTRWAAS